MLLVMLRASTSCRYLITRAPLHEELDGSFMGWGEHAITCLGALG